MTKKSSTSALNPDQKTAQDRRYAEGQEYDYLIIGTGNAALVVGSLLANAGYKICLLEAHDLPGGYAQSFRMGEFYFCGQVHYIWGAGPGGKIYEFLKHIGLEKDITFELMNPEGYDLVSLPDGKRVFLPYGWNKLAGNIEKAYPGEGAKVLAFTQLLSRLREETKYVPDLHMKWWKLIFRGWRLRTLFKYRKSTVQDIFNKFNLNKESQAILCADAGDFGLAPNRLSIIAYAGLLGGYNTGAYYPTRHYKYYIDRLAQFITDHSGCHIYYETEVTEIKVTDNKVSSVETKDGKTFTAKSFICNMDPQKASSIIGREYFPKKYLKKLDYEYSFAGLTIYLGLKDIDLRNYGFGNYNIWHLQDWDMNEMWNRSAQRQLEKSWWFMSTPNLHTNDHSNAPKGMQTLEISAFIDYQIFKDALDHSSRDYMTLKNELTKKLLDLVEQKYIPNLRKHIFLQVVGSPTTNEDFVLAPRGNSYGSAMTPKNVSLGRLKADTPFKNFWWCNASSGWAGIYGTCWTGMNLYQNLTGDNFYVSDRVPSDEDLIAALPKSS